MNQDIIWKEAIEAYFEYFLWFFFPVVAEDVDFQRGYEFLNKELAEIAQGSETGGRVADVLVKVYLKNGGERWLVIHIEVQGYREEEFARRMFIYNYRAFDRYGVDVVSLAVLADRYPNFRPRRFEIARWGFRCLFEFPIAKLLDYRERWGELEESENPFAVVVMAHLKEQETERRKGGEEERYRWKMWLVRRLYERGYSKDDVLLLYRFIDGLITLPEELTRQFHRELIEYEEERKMPYVTTAERIGMEKGLQQGIEIGRQEGERDGLLKGIKIGRQEGERDGLLKALELGLMLKFGDNGLLLYQQLSGIQDIEVLREMVERLKTANSLDGLAAFYRAEATPAQSTG